MQSRSNVEEVQVLRIRPFWQQSTPAMMRKSDKIVYSSLKQRTLVPLCVNDSSNTTEALLSSAAAVFDCADVPAHLPSQNHCNSYSISSAQLSLASAEMPPINVCASGAAPLMVAPEKSNPGCCSSRTASTAVMCQPQVMSRGAPRANWPAAVCVAKATCQAGSPVQACCQHTCTCKSVAHCGLTLQGPKMPAHCDVLDNTGKIIVMPAMMTTLLTSR